jgi:hypothetical protein
MVTLKLFGDESVRPFAESFTPNLEIRAGQAGGHLMKKTVADIFCAMGLGDQPALHDALFMNRAKDIGAADQIPARLTLPLGFVFRGDANAVIFEQ